MAVVLHGHVRTTIDVDVFIPGRLQSFAEHLRAAGFTFDPKDREFRQDNVPVHLVTGQQTAAPKELIDLDDVRTVSLADLINMKLHAGTRNILRAQDLADVIGLIRRHKLGGEFARFIDKPIRNEFRKLARAVKKDSHGRAAQAL